MTPDPAKAAPIPAEVLEAATAAVLDILNTEAILFPICPKSKRIAARVARVAIMQYREARPSLPDSREERIRAEAAEDERDRLLRLASARQDKASPLVQWLKRMGAMSPIKRHNERERKIEAEGQVASFSHALDALEVMAAAIESDTHRDAKRYIGLDIHTSFPGMMPRIHSTERAIAFLDEMRPGWRGPRDRQGEAK